MRRGTILVQTADTIIAVRHFDSVHEYMTREKGKSTYSVALVILRV